MTQNAQHIDEDIRDEVLSLFEEKEKDLISIDKKIQKIEEEGVILFDRKAIAIKNKLVEDTSVSEDMLEEKYIDALEMARKETLEDVHQKIQELLSKHVAVKETEA